MNSKPNQLNTNTTNNRTNTLELLMAIIRTFIGSDQGVAMLSSNFQACNVSMDPLLVLNISNKGLKRLFETLGPCTCNWAKWNSHLIINRT